jgi:predicted ribosome-associated RNA-binding protein Tma20
MWPGVWRIEGGLWVEGQVVALAMSEGVIVAVARMKETVKQEEFATKTGVACILLHTICDKLVAVPEVFLTKPIIMVKKELSKQEV